MVSVVDVMLITGIGALYGMPLPTHWLAIVVTLVLGAASFCALGVAVASLIRNAEAAPGVVQFVLFPLIFISGSYFPIHSVLLNHIAGALPVRPLNQALLGPFAHHAGLDWKDLAILLAWGAAGAIIAIRCLRWTPAPVPPAASESAPSRRDDGPRPSSKPGHANTSGQPPRRPAAPEEIPAAPAADRHASMGACCGSPGRWASCLTRCSFHSIRPPAA